MFGSPTNIGVVTSGEGRVWGVGGSVRLLFDYQCRAPICSKHSAGHVTYHRVCVLVKYASVGQLL